MLHVGSLSAFAALASPPGVTRRDALGMAAATGSLAFPRSTLAVPSNTATAAATAPFVVPKLGLGAWAWGDTLFWGYDEKKDSEREKKADEAGEKKDDSDKSEKKDKD